MRQTTCLLVVALLSAQSHAFRMPWFQAAATTTTTTALQSPSAVAPSSPKTPIVEVAESEQDDSLNELTIGSDKDIAHVNPDRRNYIQQQLGFRTIVRESQATSVATEPLVPKNGNAQMHAQSELHARSHPQYHPYHQLYSRGSTIPSYHGSVILNGDFMTGDLSGWDVSSPADENTWDAVVLSGGATNTQAAQHQRPSLRVEVPSDTYVMVFQDIDYNATSVLSPVPSSAAANDGQVATTTTTIPFQCGDAYLLSFDYRFLNASSTSTICAADSSLYFGIVNSEDAIDIEGDILPPKETQVAESKWQTHRTTLSASTEWASLYLYFMTKEKGGCVFEMADVGLWRVTPAANQQRKTDQGLSREL